MLMVEKNYQDLQEEVTDMRKVLKKLRSRYKQALGEIKDLEKERNVDKEDLL